MWHVVAKCGVEGLQEDLAVTDTGIPSPGVHTVPSPPPRAELFLLNRWRLHISPLSWASLEKNRKCFQKETFKMQ